MKVKSQTKDILNYLIVNGSISSMEAWEMFHITRLADVIYKLRKKGHEIFTVTEAGTGDYGAYTYARYYLDKEE